MGECKERFETQFESVINRLLAGVRLNRIMSSDIINTTAKIYDFREDKNCEKIPGESTKLETIISVLHSIACEIELSNKTLSETINGLEQILP